MRVSVRSGAFRADLGFFATPKIRLPAVFLDPSCLNHQGPVAQWRRRCLALALEEEVWGSNAPVSLSFFVSFSGPLCNLCGAFRDGSGFWVQIHPCLFCLRVLLGASATFPGLFRDGSESQTRACFFQDDWTTKSTSSSLSVRGREDGGTQQCFESSRP